jgi:hypothetical protein
MGSENVKLRKRNFTTFDGYFYTIDEDQDNLLQKTDDGNTSFSYPFDTLMGQECASLEHDGVYFWSLHDTGSNDMAIYRWKIDNYVCKLQQALSFTETGAHKYQSEAFSVAHYHTTFSSPVSSGATNLNVNKYADDSTLMGFTTTSGDPLTLHLGPNDSGQEEDVQVSTASGSVITIASGTTYVYAAGDEVNFYTYLWMFNNYDGISSAVGALYKFDAYTGDYITRYAGGAYTNVKAATFYRLQSVFNDYPDIDTLAYVKQTNTLFVNVEAAGATLPYYGSMVMENIKADEATVIDIYDIAMDGVNVYRLQKTPDGTATVWDNYSYELSSLVGFITSISLSADPAILPANGSATSNIVGYVRDQFWEPVDGREVTFTFTGPGTSITSPDTTDVNGRVDAVFTAGASADEIKITAKAEQT